MRPTSRIALFVITALAALAPGAAEAGPPCICWEIEIGSAPSLPWSGGAPDETLAVDGAVQRTFELLDAELPVLARMETLRRLAFYLDGDGRRAEAIVGRLAARVLDAEARRSAASWLRWFDAGYAASCFSQMGLLHRNGYPWIERAIELGPAEPAMHHGAALAVLMGTHPQHERFTHHLDILHAGAVDDPLLARNLELLERQAPAVLEHFASQKGDARR